MNILVIGLGSMGKRRIRLLKENINLNSMVGVDLREDRRLFVKKEYNITSYSNIDEAICEAQYDSAFICTSPLSHFGIIDKCLDYKMNVFSEINLVADGYEILIEKAKKNSLKLFLSSTLMYRKEIQYITKKVKESKQKLNYIYHVGQYLPDWHPWENYKDFFVGNKRTNGCREIFAIELPWIINAFGAIEDTFAVKSKNTNLDIDYDDNYIVTITHESGHKGVICADVVSRKAIRKLEVYGEDLYMHWGGTPETLINFDIKNITDEKISVYENIDKNPNYNENIIENMYVDEIAEFISYLQNDTMPMYSFEKDYITLKIIDEIESKKQ